MAVILHSMTIYTQRKGGKQMRKDSGFNTMAIHAGQKPCPVTGAHVAPIYQTSTFVFKNVDQGSRRFSGEEEGYIYSRLGNPTQSDLEEKMAILDKGEAAIATGSGMAAISTVLMTLLQCGDHIVADQTLYGCTHSFLKDILPRYGVEVTFADFSDLDMVKKAIKSTTKVVYLETPANPTLKIIDLKEVSQITKKLGIKLVVDNTFMTPFLQRPLELGADLVVYSATKYIGGHGDVIAGIIVGSKELINYIKIPYFKDFGGIISPFDAWLLLRGLKTLGLRMERHCSNGQKVADFLKNHQLVEKVYYPGHPNHPGHDIAKKQMDGFGGMISFELKGGFDAGTTLMNNVSLISLAVSLGCVDSLIEHPASMTHSPLPKEDRLIAGISDSFVRISVGLENVEDIIFDLNQALAKIG